jgi:hypothetical protein
MIDPASDYLAICTFGADDKPSGWRIVLCILGLFSLSLIMALSICGILERQKIFKYLASTSSRRERHRDVDSVRMKLNPIIVDNEQQKNNADPIIV